MKRLVMICLVVLLAGVTANQVLACHISIAPETLDTIAVESEITIEVLVEKEHRRCPLEDGDVTVVLSENAEIVEQSAWDAQGSNSFTSTFILKILEAGPVRFQILRECRKKGISEQTLEFEAR